MKNILQLKEELVYTPQQKLCTLVHKIKSMKYLIYKSLFLKKDNEMKDAI